MNLCRQRWQPVQAVMYTQSKLCAKPSLAGREPRALQSKPKQAPVGHRTRMKPNKLRDADTESPHEVQRSSVSPFSHDVICHAQMQLSGTVQTSECDKP
jgi:hypothetical protein